MNETALADARNLERLLTAAAQTVIRALAPVPQHMRNMIISRALDVLREKVDKQP